MRIPVHAGQSTQRSDLPIQPPKVWGWIIGTVLVVGMIIWGMTYVEKRRLTLQGALVPPSSLRENAALPNYQR